jgi:hypothetical protein
MENPRRIELVVALISMGNSSRMDKQFALDKRKVGISNPVKPPPFTFMVFLVFMPV